MGKDNVVLTLKELVEAVRDMNTLKIEKNRLEIEKLNKNKEKIKTEADKKINSIDKNIDRKRIENEKLLKTKKTVARTEA